MLFLIAFFGGILMILAPCSLATIPAYLGVAFTEKKKIALRAFLFFLGFALVYAFLGLGASFIGRALNLYQDSLVLIAGIFLVFFGVLVFLGRGFTLPFKLSPRFTQSRFGPFFLGIAFSLGYSACTGPILAGILTIAATLPTWQAVGIMFSYSLGIGFPLIFLSLFLDRINLFNQPLFVKPLFQFRLLKSQIRVGFLNLLSSFLLIFLGVIFIIFRNTVPLIVKFPQAITDFTYGLQEKLLAFSSPPAWVNIALFVLVGFFFIKFLGTFWEEQKILKLRFHSSQVKIGLMLVIILFFIVNTWIAFNTRAEIEEKIAQAQEATRPANLEITIIKDPQCESCFDIDRFLDDLKSQNIKIISEKNLDFQTPEAQELISLYQVQKLPTIIIKGELKKEKTLENLWQNLGEIKQDSFILTNIPPPYLELVTGKIRGEFDLILLSDKICQDCYNVVVHKSILSHLGLIKYQEKEIDISSSQGKELIENYNINFVPTILLQGDLAVYQNLNSIWLRVGTIETDGTYVFKEGVKQMGVYKDLTTNQIIRPVTQ